MPKVVRQLDMLGNLGVEATKPAQPEPPRTRVRLGNRQAAIPLHRRRREAVKKLLEVLGRLEDKDVHIGFNGGSGSHFWLHNLKLGRLKVEPVSGRDLPSVIVLWGSREASVRIFTDQLVAVREQQYSGYTLWLVDFWNGFGEHPLDPYRPPGYVSLQIVQFHDPGKEKPTS